MPDPATRSLTVLETRISPGPAWAATRAPMCTATPPIFSPTISHSPVCRPARTSSPSSRTESLIARAHRIARAGPSKLAKKPSPAVSSSRPRNRSSWRRITTWCEERSSAQRWSPRSDALAVEPTMSVKRTVLSTVSGSASPHAPERKLRLRWDRLDEPDGLITVGDLDPFRLGDPLRHVLGVAAVVGPVQDQGRDANRRENVAHVHVHRHPVNLKGVKTPIPGSNRGFGALTVLRLDS